ncbi:hypothetical protein EDB89DRAFT_1914277 [Lactarius sanguifluus]|nr:hypothetical protein EDB89DRAFT_1914277 [Lactarius sanguifluus]
MGKGSGDGSGWVGRGIGGTGMDGEGAGNKLGSNDRWASRGIRNEEGDMVWASDRPGGGSKDVGKGGKGAGEDVGDELDGSNGSASRGMAIVRSPSSAHFCLTCFTLILISAYTSPTMMLGSKYTDIDPTTFHSMFSAQPIGTTPPLTDIWISLHYEELKYVMEDPVEELAEAFTRLALVHADLSLIEKDVETTKLPSIVPQTNTAAASRPITTSVPIIMPSIPIVHTITPITTPAVPMAMPRNPSTGGKLSGNAPTIFDGN